MNYHARTCSVFILVCLPYLFYGQNENQSIEGKIVDSTSKLAVPFATIKIKTKMMGVVSNGNGDFQIPLKFKDLNDSIVVSCIGYTKTTISFRDLRESSPNVIKLKPAVQSLDEVVVSSRKKLSASKVLNNAIENLKLNYPQEPFSYLGYYRDYQQLDTSYLNLNEGIVQIFDNGFQTGDLQETKILMYEYKVNTDFPRDSSTSVPYDNKPGKFGHGKNKYIPNAVLSPLGGNELSILRLHDAIRNYDRFSFSFVDIFVKDFEKNHFLKMEEGVNLDSISLYCISFESKYSASGPRNFSRGKLFIEKGNFAIHKIEYATFNKTMRETQLMYEIHTEYSRVGPLMYLNYISFANEFKTRNDTDFKVIEIEYDKVKNAFVLDFNTVPERRSVSDTSNYQFRLDKKHLRINKTLMTGERQISLFLDDSSGKYLSEHAEEISSKLQLTTTDIRDVDNRQLDKATNATLFQFRELFVQKVFPGKTTPPNFQFVDSNVPLTKNAIYRSSKISSNFWMNSPLKKNAR